MNPARAGTIYLAGNLAAASVPFLLLPLLTRILPPAEYGTVVNYFLLVAVCGAAAGLGVHGALGVAWFREQRQDLPRVVGSALLVGLGSTAVVALAAAAIVAALAPDALGFGPAFAALAAVSAGANVLVQCRLVLWQSAHRPLANATMQVAASVLNVALSLLGVLVLRWGGEGRIAGAAAAAIVMALAAIVLLFAARQVRLEFRRADLRMLLGFGIALVPHTLAGVMLSSADRFVVSALLGTETLGSYGAAAQLGAVMALLADAFVKAFNPWLYARLQSTDRHDALRAVGAMYGSVPGFLMLAAVVAALLMSAGQLLLGPAYQDALDIIPWFMLGGAFSGMYLAVSGLFFFHNRTGVLGSVSLPTVAAGLVATVFLVDRFGMSGAAAGYALTQGLLALTTWGVAHFAFALPWHMPAQALAAWWRAAASSGRPLEQ